ncbi:MAG: hypothetical protein U0169_04440 [Polyangiaceae bacterium]
MLWNLVKSTEWKPFAELVSPSFFDVVPMRTLSSELGKLVAARSDARGFERAVAERDGALVRSGIAVRVRAEDPKVHGATIADAKRRGARVLALYFHQIFDEGTALLDFRSERFSEEGEGDDATTVWRPSRVVASFRPEFRGAMRATYRGFYREDDALFRQGLTALGVAKAEDAFRAQFGEGDQRAVRFSRSDFQAKFRDVFVRCRDTGSRIDGAFLPLGLGLATLYEHLESLGEPFDVRAAYESVDGAPS